MVIRIGNIYSEIIESTDIEWRIIRDICTINSIKHYKRKGELHPRKYVKKKCYLRGSKFPTGLLTLLPKSDLSIEYRDRRQYKAEEAILYDFTSVYTSPENPTGEADYGFQEEAVKIAVKKQRGLLWYPTGSGKTVIIAKIIRELKLSSLVIVPNKELLWQTYRKFKEYFNEYNVGIFGDNIKEGFQYPITIATQQSLYSLLKKDKKVFARTISKVRALFIDECHHVGTATKTVKKENGKKVTIDKGNSWWDVAMEIDCIYRYGVSATVISKDNPNNAFVLTSATGKIIAFITESELIQRKVLCPLRTIMIEVPALSCKTWKNVYKKKGKERVLISEGAFETNILATHRSKLICDIVTYCYNRGKRVLVLVDWVDKHGVVLTSMMKVPAIFLSGINNREERDIGIQKFIEDRKVLVSTIVKEGFDVPAIDAIVIAGGGKSDKALIQKIGRGRRVAVGKEYTEVWDIYDDDGESSYGPRMCLSHSKSRQEIYYRVKEDITTTISLLQAYKLFEDKTNE